MSGIQETNPVVLVATAGREAWEQIGQFTSPDVGEDDPEGRATLYIAGFIAGFNQAWSAAFRGGVAFQKVAQEQRAKRLTEEEHRGEEA